MAATRASMTTLPCGIEDLDSNNGDQDDVRDARPWSWTGCHAGNHLALTAGLLLMPSPRDDCLLLRRRRESTGVSAAGSNISAELGIFTCLKTAMRLKFVRSYITRDAHILRFGLS